MSSVIILELHLNSKWNCKQLHSQAGNIICKLSRFHGIIWYLTEEKDIKNAEK